MKEFMHVGVPTTVAREGEIYAEGIKTHLITPEHTRIAFIMKDGILFELMEEVK